MKKIISLAVSMVMVLSMMTFIHPVSAEAVADLMYVSAGAKNGNGSSAAPFGTIEEARDAIRTLKKNGGLPIGGIDVIIRDGEYKITSPIVLTAEDSGTAESPIRYISENKHGAKLHGGVKLNYDDFTTLTAGDKSRIYGSAAAAKIASIKRLDLKKYGITTENVGMLYSGSNPLVELFVDGNKQTIARYPNEGYLKVAEQTDKPNYSLIVDGDTASRIKSWRSLDNVGLFAYPTYNWYAETMFITSFNESENKIEVPGPTVYNGFIKDARYYLSNIFDELDASGEYYVDTDTCVLYAYLPANSNTADISISMYSGNLINIDGAKYVTFKDMEVSMTRGATGISVTSDNVTLDGLKMYGIGGNAINAEGYSLTIMNCDISGTGEGGITVKGGDIKTLTPSNILIYNNYIHHWSTKGLTYRSAVTANGVGVTVSHNEMAYTNHMAVGYSGNDHLIEYNHIHHVTTDTSDAGAIYSGRRWTDYGTVIRYNYIHHVGHEELGGVNGIYLDDGLSGHTVYGNVITDVYGSAIVTGGGRDNSFYNNIFVDILSSRGKTIVDPFGIDARVRIGAENPDTWFGDSWRYASQFEEVPYNTGIWAEKYPNLAKVKYQKGTFEFTDIYAFYNTAFVIVKNNAMYVSGKGPKVMRMNFSDFTHDMTPELKASCDFTNNELVAKDLSDFVDAANGNFTLKADAKVFTEIPGFYSIPFSDIGLVKASEEKVMNFDDVKSGDWFYSAADFAYKNGLMNGTSATMFSPMLKMSRAQLVTVLYRLDGQCMSAVNVPFDDLTQDWYKAAVAWAYENGIVNGTAATKFSPDGDLTREQTATILMRYCSYKGYNTSASVDVSTFPDAGKIGSWSLEAMRWACAEGLLTGKPSGSTVLLDPQGSATRSEVATILMRFCDKY